MGSLLGRDDWSEVDPQVGHQVRLGLSQVHHYGGVVVGGVLRVEELPVGIGPYPGGHGARPIGPYTRGHVGELLLLAARWQVPCQEAAFWQEVRVL